MDPDISRKLTIAIFQMVKKWYLTKIAIFKKVLSILKNTFSKQFFFKFQLNVQLKFIVTEFIVLCSLFEPYFKKETKITEKVICPFK